VLGLIALLAVLLLPGLDRRRRAARTAARLFFRVAGIRLEVDGLERLPDVPCVLVANHSSYIDGIVAVAALPAQFTFVIKKEMSRAPLAGLLLRRIGSQFVERFDRHKGAADARRVMKAAATGQSLVFFPQGTFTAEAVVGRFLNGAFSTAARSNRPIVAAAIHGTREVLPAATCIMRRHPIRVEILEILGAEGARERSREIIARAVGEPMAP
jgi:1-acyl-sn-glycerol-3-phosphate acyltransferase